MINEFILDPKFKKHSLKIGNMQCELMKYWKVSPKPVKKQSSIVEEGPNWNHDPYCLQIPTMLSCGGFDNVFETSDAFTRKAYKILLMFYRSLMMVEAYELDSKHYKSSYNRKGSKIIIHGDLMILPKIQMSGKFLGHDDITVQSTFLQWTTRERRTRKVHGAFIHNVHYTDQYRWWKIKKKGIDPDLHEKNVRELIRAYIDEILAIDIHDMWCNMF